jgi:hypothetical protein
MTSLKAMMKKIEKAGIELDNHQYSWDRQDSYNNDTINGPNKYRGRFYSPMSFSDERDQIDQAEKILAVIAARKK